MGLVGRLAHEWPHGERTHVSLAKTYTDLLGLESSPVAPE